MALKADLISAENKIIGFWFGALSTFCCFYLSFSVYYSQTSSVILGVVNHDAEKTAKRTVLKPFDDISSKNDIDVLEVFNFNIL